MNGWVKGLVAVGWITCLGCDEGLRPYGSRHHSVIAIDLNERQNVRSVADRIGLSIVESDDQEQSFARVLSVSDSVITFPVVVAAGSTRFAAEVRSNNEALLYSGERTAQIQENGFVVEISLEPRGPILTVFPDTLLIDSGSAGTLIVENVGSGTLASWSIAEMQPPQSSCPRACFLFSRSEGFDLPPGEEDTLFVEPVLASIGQEYTLRFESEVGGMNVQVIVQSAATPPPGSTP